MSSTNHSVADILPPRVVHLASPQRGIGPLLLHGGALRRAALSDASLGSQRASSFTDLRFSPAQRKMGSYG